MSEHADMDQEQEVSWQSVSALSARQYPVSWSVRYHKCEAQQQIYYLTNRHKFYLECNERKAPKSS